MSMFDTQPVTSQKRSWSNIALACVLKSLEIAPRNPGRNLNESVNRKDRETLYAWEVNPVKHCLVVVRSELKMNAQ